MCRPATSSAANCYYPPASVMSYPNTTHRGQSFSPSPPSVRFSETTNTRVIPGLWQLSHDETSTMYYTNADLLGIRSSLQTSAKLLRRATKRGTTLEDLTSQTDTSRGIEHLASKAMLLRVHTEKAHSVRIALVAQQDEGASPEHIAHVTSMATRDAAVRAVERARQDEAAAYGPCDIVEQEEPFESLAFPSTSIATTTREGGLRGSIGGISLARQVSLHV